MNLEVTLDYEVSERAGAGGMAQIVSVKDSESGADLSSQVDCGMHFTSEGKDLDRYLKSVFGDDISYEVVD